MNLLATWKSQLRTAIDSSAFRHYWQQLSAKDRSTLLLLAAFLISVLFYMGLWLPAERKLQRAQSYYQEQQALYAYLKRDAEHARQIAKTTNTGLLPEQVQGVVVGSAKAHGIPVDRFDNDGDAGVSLSLDRVAFKPLLVWLAELQSQGIQLTEVGLHRVDDGSVGGRLVVRAERL